MIWLIVLAIASVLFAVYASKATSKKEAEKIVKTKILTSNPHYTGRLNGSFYTETTFMVYYTDNTHKAITVKNGTIEYDSYMSKLEG